MKLRKAGRPATKQDRQNERKVLDWVKDLAKDSEYGKGLVVKQFKYLCENIDAAPGEIEDALEELDRAGKIDLLAFVDGPGEYDNIVIRLPRQKSDPKAKKSS